MRTHLQIITDAGGYQGFAAKIHEPSERVRFWQRRKAIPPEKWKLVADAGVATLEELADAAAARASDPTPQQGAAA